MSEAIGSSHVSNPRALRFYFSFRSPYAWLALHRIELLAKDQALDLEYVPVFPPPEYPNDPTKVPAKAAYIRLDVARLAAAYGKRLQMPESLDCDWVRPHAAFLCALDSGAGPAFARELFEARFCAGASLGDDAVIARCAVAVGLDGDTLVRAQGDTALQERVVLGMIRGVQEDGLFGVPLFVLGGERFWGNDRIDWLLRHIEQQRGLPVPDLMRSPLSHVNHST